MKFLALIVISIFVYTVSSAPTTVGPDVDALKKQLEDKAVELETKLADEIPKHKHEAHRLTTEEEELKKLVKELEAAKDEHQVKAIERRLKEMEHRVEEELTRLANRTDKPTEEPTTAAAPEADPTTEANVDDVKKQLEERAVQLEKRIADEIKRLEGHVGNAHIITRLRMEHMELRVLAAELKNAVSHLAINLLERRLKEQETRIEEELNKIEDKTGAPPTVPTAPEVDFSTVTEVNIDVTTEATVDEVKKALEERAVKLEKRIADEIKRLEGKVGNAHVITKLRKEEEELKDLSAELKNASTHDHVNGLEHRLKNQENRIEEELNKIDDKTAAPTEGPTTAAPVETTAAPVETTAAPVQTTVVPPEADPTTEANADALKKQLEDKAADLEKMLTQEIPKHKHEGKRLAAEEEELKKLVKDLEAAKDEHQVKAIERRLKEMEHRVEEELTRLANRTDKPTEEPTTVAAPEADPTTDANVDDLKKQLEDKAAELEKKLADEIPKHKHLAHILVAEEAGLKFLVKELEAAKDEQRLSAIEHRLKEVERRVDEELTRLANRTDKPEPTTPAAPVADDNKQELEDKAAELEKKVADEIKKLEGKVGNAHEITRLRIEEEELKHLAAALKVAKDEHTIQTLEHRLKGIETRVEEQLAKIEGRTDGPEPTTGAY